MSKSNAKKPKRIIIISVIVAFMAIIAIFWHNPYEISTANVLAKPSFSHLLGCDNLGRDIFSRVVLGGVFSIGIAFLSVALSTIVGTIIGSIAGYYNGIYDSIITMLTEALMSIPAIVIALGVMVVLKPGFASIIVAIFLMYLSRVINMVRGLVNKEKHMEYVVAAHTYGLSDWRVMFVHILPNIKKNILINFTTGFAGAILTEAGLGYLGLGIQPPYPTLGNILNQSQSYFLSSPCFTIAPGVAIVFIVYQMNKIEKKRKRF